jgi:hypothetical protein
MKLTFMPQKCAGCPIEFVPTRSSKKFHSSECLKLHRARLKEEKRAARPPTVKVCAFCGEEYRPDKFDGLGRRVGAQRKYCSSAHRDAAMAKIQKAKRRAKSGRTLCVRGRTMGKLAELTVRQLDAVRELLDPENPISVRGCCYHLLSMGLLDSTEDFNGMCKKITDARLRENDDPSFLPDNCFVDHSRVLEYEGGYSNVDNFLALVKESYNRDPWQEQPIVPIILCEKRGHGDILKKTCDAEHVRLFLSKGIHARSFLCLIADHCAKILSNGQGVRIGYLGDHDPTGLQMEVAAENGNNKKGVSRREGLRQILDKKYGIAFPDLTWTRLALTTEQFLNLPQEARVPVKAEDNNARNYASRFGTFGGEVEALGFERLQNLVRDFIDEQKDTNLWSESLIIEQQENIRLAEAHI